MARGCGLESVWTDEVQHHGQDCGFHPAPMRDNSGGHLIPRKEKFSFLTKQGSPVSNRPGCSSCLPAGFLPWLLPDGILPFELPAPSAGFLPWLQLNGYLP